MPSDLDVLIGQRIEGFDVGDEEHALRIRTNGEPVYCEVDGDCCSESWFADILGAVWVQGGTVTTTRELELPQPQDGRSRQEEDSAYGYAIDTERGTVIIAFRNSSNGYYGGDMTVTDQEPRGNTWRPIETDDWSA
jgi:hypothetical protein